MRDEDKSKELLISELLELRQRITQMEAAIAESDGVKEELRAAQRYSQELINCSLDMIVAVDRDRRIFEFNKAAQMGFGYRSDEVLGRYIDILYADPDEGMEISRAIIEKGQFTGEAINRRKDGETFPCFLSSSMLYDEAGNFIGIMGISRDITERKRAEEELREYQNHLEELVRESTEELTVAITQLQKEIADRKRIEKELRESEEMYQTIFEIAGNAAIMLEEDTTISLGNAEFEKLSGYPREEIEGIRSWDEFITSNTLDRMGPDTAPGNYEVQFIDKEKNIRDCLFTISIVPGTTKSLVLFTDITKHKEEAEQIQAAKMNALSQLVAGLAHQMNNPIGVVLSNNDISSRSIGKINQIMTAECSQEMLDYQQLVQILAILEATNNENRTALEEVTKIVSNLRRFVRLDEADWQFADIHEGMDGAIALMEPEFSKRIKITKDYGDIPKIHCCPSSLNQAFANLLRNASEAIESEGEICIRTTFQEGHVEIIISDTGRGIAEKDMDRIFDPGFTTKGLRVGVGFGLPICYKIIVEEHKGRIHVSSKAGKETKFVIMLPQDCEASSGRSGRNVYQRLSARNSNIG